MTFYMLTLEGIPLTAITDIFVDYWLCIYTIIFTKAKQIINNQTEDEESDPQQLSAVILMLPQSKTPGHLQCPKKILVFHNLGPSTIS